MELNTRTKFAMPGIETPLQKPGKDLEKICGNLNTQKHTPEEKKQERRERTGNTNYGTERKYMNGIH